MPWRSRKLRGQRVWAQVDADGNLLIGVDGRVDIVYQHGGKVYRANPRNLEPDAEPETMAPRPASEVAPVVAPGVAPVVASGVAKRGQPIVVYADGACQGNPGPAGIGVVILNGGEREEISEYLGEATNNIAELTAIVRALERLPRDKPIHLYSDSAYALGLLGKGWKPKANRELVERMRRLAAEFSHIRLYKVEGHAGVPENERADALARQGASDGRKAGQNTGKRR